VLQLASRPLPESGSARRRLRSVAAPAFVVGFVAAAGMLASGLLVTRPRYVDDEVRAPAAASPHA